jgi:hypothetical protein
MNPFRSNQAGITGASGPVGPSPAVIPPGANGPVGVTGVQGYTHRPRSFLIGIFLNRGIPLEEASPGPQGPQGRMTDIPSLDIKVSTQSMGVPTKEFHIQLLGGETASDILFKMGLQTEPVASALIRDLVDTFGEAGEMVVEKLTEGAVNEFNEKWAREAFKDLLRLHNVKDKLSYDQAVTAINEVFVIEVVHNQ